MSDARATTVVARESKEAASWRSLYTIAIVATLLVLVFLGVYYYNFLFDSGKLALGQITSKFYWFMLAGFIAQMIDGALGMAYGVSASTFLLTLGVPPALSSASIHTSEIFTSGVSGLMHLKFQNVNKKLLKTLLLPGIFGAALGAILLTSLEDYEYVIKPLIACYTLYLGVVIVRKALVGVKTRIKSKRIPALAVFGSFMDSIGGGGWGPIVSSTLIAGGRHPRYTIGSVNLAEFFVAVSSAFTFILVLVLRSRSSDLEELFGLIQVVAGLILGGIIAAPIAAYFSRKLPVKKLMITVGIVVILVSIRIFLKSFSII